MLFRLRNICWKPGDIPPDNIKYREGRNEENSTEIWWDFS